MKSVELLLFTCLIVLVSGACTESSVKQSGNAALDNILGRKSVREYIDKEVESEKIMALMKAGMAAPSGKNMRPWEFVVIKERGTLDSLAVVLPYAKMLAQAPMAIIVCGDPARSSYWYLDCSAAAENILLAAESMGLGAVWTAAYPYEDRMKEVRKYTGIPSNLFPLCVVPVGYPKRDQPPMDKFDATKIHYERY